MRRRTKEPARAGIRHYCGGMMTWDTHYFFTTAIHYWHCQTCCDKGLKCLFKDEELQNSKVERFEGDSKAK